MSTRIFNKNRITFVTNLATCLFFATNLCAEQSGSLYPESALSPEMNEIAEALGPARYILSPEHNSEEFSRSVQRAVGSHPVYYIQVSQKKVSGSGARAERAALYPQLAANLSGDYVVARDFRAGTDNVVESLQPKARANAGLSVSQLLFDGGATSQRIKAAKARDRENGFSLKSRINELSISAVSAYHDLAIHRAIYAFGQQFIQRHEALLEDVKERSRLGAGTKADVLRVEARLAAARARVTDIKESMRLAEVRYEEFFEKPATILSRQKFHTKKLQSRDTAMMLAIDSNPEIAASRTRIDQARAEFKAVKASRVPEIRATVNATKYDIFDGTDDYDVRAGLNLNYNLFSGGARAATIAQARETARQKSYDASRIRDEVGREAAISFERLEAANEKLHAHEAAIVANFGARDLIAERFKAARGDLIDVLQAENDHFESGVAYMISLVEADLAAYSMMTYTGDLVRLFSPQNEYADQVGNNG